MKTAEEILEKHCAFRHLSSDGQKKTFESILEAMHEFAIEAIKADREDCAENVRFAEKGEDDYDYDFTVISKSSITDRPLPTFKQ